MDDIKQYGGFTLCLAAFIGVFVWFFESRTQSTEALSLKTAIVWIVAGGAVILMGYILYSTTPGRYYPV